MSYVSAVDEVLRNTLDYLDLFGSMRNFPLYQFVRAKPSGQIETVKCAALEFPRSVSRYRIPSKMWPDIIRYESYGEKRRYRHWIIKLPSFVI